MEIIRNAIMPGMPLPSRTLTKWPFREMNVGDMVKFTSDDSEFDAARNYAHTYASKTGKKFVTRKIAQELHIYRVG